MCRRVWTVELGGKVRSFTLLGISIIALVTIPQPRHYVLVNNRLA